MVVWWPGCWVHRRPKTRLRPQREPVRGGRHFGSKGHHEGVVIILWRKLSYRFLNLLELATGVEPATC